MKNVIEEIDLRPICRMPDQYGVTIYLLDENGHRGTGWLWLGEASLERCERADNRLWTLKAYLGPRSEKESIPTDFEHDSAYACQLPLVGVKMNSIRYHTTTVSAWIDPNGPSDGFHRFHVPKTGYDPRKHEDATICQDADCLEAGLEDGGGPHVIVPEGLYVPPFDPELYEAVRGRQVEIFFYQNEPGNATPHPTKEEQQASPEPLGSISKWLFSPTDRY